MERFFGAGTAIENPFASRNAAPVKAGYGEGVRAVQVPLEDLLKSYVVSYGDLLGHKDSEDQDESEAECSEEDVEEMEVDEKEDDDGEKEENIEKDDINENEIASDKKAKRKKKKASDKIKKEYVGDYDFDDPFIDDDEVAVAYESVFDLLNGEEIDDDNEDADHGDNSADKKKKKKRGNEDDKPALREFFVYRGEMQVEVVSKLRGRRKEKTAEKSGEPSKSKQKKSRDDSGRSAKKLKEKEEKISKKRAARRDEEGRLERAAEPKVSTLERILNLEAKLDEPVKAEPSTTEDSSKASPEKSSKRPTPDYDRLYADLESRLAFEAWKTQAKSIDSFDPAKYPSVLRDLTGSLALCYLRAAAPHHNDIEDSLFAELAKLVPYQAGAIKKVTMKKILPIFQDEIGRKLVGLYEAFAKEMSAVPAPSTSNNLEASQPMAPGEGAIAEDASQPAAATKQKIKFSENARHLIYEIVRFELDLLYLDQTIKCYEPSPTSPPVPKLAGEMVLRRAIYQKIRQALPSPLPEHCTTNDISLQFGQFKRKFERKFLKDHGVEVEGVVVGEKRKAPPLVDVKMESADPALVEHCSKKADPEAPNPAPSSLAQTLLSAMLFPSQDPDNNS